MSRKNKVVAGLEQATEFEKMGNRCSEIIQAYGGRVPCGPTLKLVADFAYALGVDLNVRLLPVSVREVSRKRRAKAAK